MMKMLRELTTNKDDRWTKEKKMITCWRMLTTQINKRASTLWTVDDRRKLFYYFGAFSSQCWSIVLLLLSFYFLSDTPEFFSLLSIYLIIVLCLLQLKSALISFYYSDTHIYNHSIIWATCNFNFDSLIFLYWWNEKYSEFSRRSLYLPHTHTLCAEKNGLFIRENAFMKNCKATKYLRERLCVNCVLSCLRSSCFFSILSFLFVVFANASTIFAI